MQGGAGSSWSGCESFPRAGDCRPQTQTTVLLPEGVRAQINPPRDSCLWFSKRRKWILAGWVHWGAPLAPIPLWGPCFVPGGSSWRVSMGLPGRGWETGRGLLLTHSSGKRLFPTQRGGTCSHGISSPGEGAPIAARGTRGGARRGCGGVGGAGHPHAAATGAPRWHPGTPTTPRARGLPGKGGTALNPFPGCRRRDVRTGGVFLGLKWLGKVSSRLSRALHPQHGPLGWCGS